MSFCHANKSTNSYTSLSISVNPKVYVDLSIEGYDENIPNYYSSLNISFNILSIS